MPGIKGIRALVACVLGAGLVLAGVVQLAQAQQNEIESAKRQLSAGNPKKAYMDLIALQGKMAGNLEFDYVLGVAALDSGKVDDAVISFERVLAANPRHAGAKLDLARAYYTAGAFDLAEATFISLKNSNPPPLALQSINRYLTAIREHKKAAKPGFSGYGELGIGHDSNITGVPGDFSSAVLSSFNLSGVSPTGNSIRRAANFLNSAAGFDFYYPLSRGWSAFTGVDVRGRGYRNAPDFASKSAEIRFGGALNNGPQQWRVTASAMRFDQKGEAPGDPKPTNDRQSASLGTDWRYTVNQKNQVGLGAQYSAQRFPDNNVEDFNQALASASWLHSFDARGMPVMYLSGFYSNDDAVRKLPDGISDKSKRLGGLRSSVQVSFSQSIQGYTGLGLTLRKDQSAFARATEIEFGRDKLADVSLGLNWHFQQRCSLRIQWLYSRNDSNIAIYDYSRNEGSSTIRCDFE